MNARHLIAASLLILLLSYPSLATEARSCPGETDTCLEAMTEDLRSRGWLGIKIGREAETGEAVVAYVFPDSPAQSAGMEVGDRLLSLNGTPYSHENEAKLRTTYKSFAPGDRVTYRIARGKETFPLEIELGALPEALIARWVGQHLLEGHTDHGHEEAANKP